MKNMFRRLRADEIECRVQSITAKGLVLLLYKDARCDQNILDETVGALNWQRSHSRDNSNCVVSIWNSEIQQWVKKEDTGTESYTEKEKGKASDSFKRACFNWGIGRELYTAPFIWIASKDYTASKNKDGKPTTYDKFEVTKISYSENGKIDSLEIKNTKTGNTVYRFCNSKLVKDTFVEETYKLIKTMCKGNENLKQQVSEAVKHYGVDKFLDLTSDQANEIYKVIKLKSNN